MATGLPPRTRPPRAQALAPLKGILPNVRVEAGYLRTTDPIGVFGSTLRQRAVTQANFDPAAPQPPGRLGNYQAGIVLEQPLFNADAWAGRRPLCPPPTPARGRGVDAARRRVWTSCAPTTAPCSLPSASRRFGSAAGAAHAHVAQAEAMVRQGLVTKSDALLASVRAGDVDAQLAEAEGAAATARRQLAVLLGRDGGRSPRPISHRGDAPAADRADSGRSRRRTRRRSPGTGARRRARGDRCAGGGARRRACAPGRAVAAPQRLRALRLELADARSTPATGIGRSASWRPGRRSPVRASSPTSSQRRPRAGRASAGGSRARERADSSSSRRARRSSVALTRLAIAEQRRAQSAEAHRIVARKYERRPCQRRRAARRTSGRDAERARRCRRPAGPPSSRQPNAARARPRPRGARVARYTGNGRGAATAPDPVTSLTPPHPERQGS